MKKNIFTNKKLALITNTLLFSAITASAQVGSIGFEEADSAMASGNSDFLNAMSLISNVVLGIAAVIGVCLTTFALLSAAMDGRWDEAKSKIGAGFALIVVPAALKAVWAGVASTTTSF
jgi:hypothetical protein